MKKTSILLLLGIFMLGTASAQTKLPAGMRMEAAESETDHGDYSVFSYKDTDDDATFGYYLGLGRVNDFLGADEIFGMEVKNIRETAVCLGTTTKEALAKLDDILDLYDNELESYTELTARTVTNTGTLGKPTTIVCRVVKKPLGGKRLLFIFSDGQHYAHTYLTKSVVKELRAEFKIDIKLHPKQHRKE